MSYKKFEDWYREGNIKHLLLYEHDGYLISPPFGTERCKDYCSIMVYNGSISYITDVTMPMVVSKTNCVVTVNNKSWFIPYGIYENSSTMIQLDKKTPIEYPVDFVGRGQFYSGASNNNTAFSFPLGYEGTQYCLYIVDDIPKLIHFNCVEKAHMGTVYHNGRYYSMPRGDKPGYNDLVSFDGEQFRRYYVPVNSEITRKYTDLVVVGDKLYSLPYGEQSGLNEVVEFDPVTEQMKLYKLDVPDFAKKYNSMVKLGHKIIGLPYGDEYCNDSNYGIVFDTITKESKSFDIKITHGGKYRYRCGIEFNGNAVFFPTGTPQCPVFVVDIEGNIVKIMNYEHHLFGRPVIYKNKLHILSYHIKNETHHLFIFDEKYKTEIIDL